MPSIIYVRARLRLERGGAVDLAPTWASHAVALAGVGAAAASAALPWTSTLPYLVLALRAVLGVSPWRVGVPAKVIGFRELGYGVLRAVVVGLGARGGLG